MDEPDYIVVGRHEEDGLVYELVVMREEVEALQLGTLEAMWLNNPRVLVTRSK
jgi:hypothetical protein